MNEGHHRLNLRGELQGLAWREQSERERGVQQPCSIAALDRGPFACFRELAYEALPFGAVVFAQRNVQDHLDTKVKRLSNS
jgi:hypothetical protein